MTTVTMNLPDNCRTIMIKERSPGPYEDILGPTLLALLLMVAILLQFLWKALSISYFWYHEWRMDDNYWEKDEEQKYFTTMIRAGMG